MFAGQLRHAITVQRRTSTQDDYGQKVNTWSAVATVKADIRPVGGREQKAAMEMMAKLTHTVAVRFQTALVPPLEASAWRVLFGTRVLNIVNSRNLEEKNRWIIFECEEGSRDGE